MGFDNAYDAITEEVDDHRWAFGTGFADSPYGSADPLLGVDASVPAGVSGADLGDYCQMLGDDALVLSHRLQEWLTRAPELEEETALANIALDLLGQARLLLSRAGQTDGTARSEDAFAYGRDSAQFRNVNVAEVSDGDFAALMLRLLVFTSWRLAVLERLTASRDAVLAAVGAKGATELTYHRDYAAQWVIRLGDGTDYSRALMCAALAGMGGAAGELFAVTEVERRLVEAGIAADPSAVRSEVQSVLRTVTEHAGLPRLHIADGSPAGRLGAHTAEFGALVEELQCVARAHPGATW